MCVFILPVVYATVSRGQSGISKWRLVGVVAVLSFGFTALLGAVGLNTLGPVVFILGFFILIPMILLLGTDFPLVAPDGDTEETTKADSDPVATLRERYADGELTEAEFEGRLERLLEAERRQQDTEEHPADRIETQLEELEKDPE